ncbi:hypothetical protein Teth514_1791 [Thermoanaerobacter sp. X514]|nr:hypothetical protein Teth514_1791 [Thermoanaerobacter sp. X514]
MKNMKNKFYMFLSILVIVLALIWISFFQKNGVELVLVVLSLGFSVFTILLILLYEKKKK